MRTIWGAFTEVRDLGIVAEHCVHCGRLMSCLLRSVCRGDYVFFLKTTDPFQECSCLCTGCLKAFHCAYWRYAEVVPIQEAKALPLDDLLSRTNPILAERLQFKEQVGTLGGDVRFAVAYEHLEGMRPGILRSRLLRQLLDWDRLEEPQRASLVQQIGALTRAGHFARQMVPGFPAHAAFPALAVAALVALPAFMWMPALSASVIVAATLIAMAFSNHMLITRKVCRWTRRVLIPEAQDADVPLESFVTVVDDVPGSWHGITENLWRIKDRLETIHSVLIAEEKLRQ